MISRFQKPALIFFFSLLILFTYFKASRAGEPGRDEYLYARKLFDERYYDLAAEQLERVLRDYPGFSEAVEAQYLLSEAYLISDKFEKARASFLRLAIVYPKSPHAPESLFKVGVTLEEADRPLDAAEAYIRVHGFYPEDRYAPEGLRRSIDLYLINRDTLKAETTMDLLLSKYPDSEAADAARLYKAKILIRFGDRELGERFLGWISERSRTDSIAAEAWFELGRLKRENEQLDEAEWAFRQPIEKFPASRIAYLCRIELSDLFNYRGLFKASIDLLKPVLASEDELLKSLASIKAGNARYRQKEFSLAFKYYNAVAKINPEAALKAAWMKELLGNDKDALNGYLMMIGGHSGKAREARRRAAILSGKLGQWAKSAQLWSKVIDDKSCIDSSGRTEFEFIKVRFKADQSIKNIAKRAINKYPMSPWADDMAYLHFLDALKSSLLGQPPVLPDPLEYMKKYPASELLDSAVTVRDFYRRHFVRSDNLMERMAELSSRPSGSVSKAEWAKDWGDFYLYEFKDPLKALDQYRNVIDEVIVMPEDLVYAYQQSVIAYLQLFETAIWEQDEFSIQMYSDSCLSWAAQLSELDPHGAETIQLTSEFMRLSLAQSVDNPQQNSRILAHLENLIETHSIDRIPPEISLLYFDRLLLSGDLDSAKIVDSRKMIKRAIKAAEDMRTRSRLKLTGVLLLELAGEFELARVAAESLVSEFPDSPGGAAAVAWLMENPRLPMKERYDSLSKFTQNYPYLLNPVAHEMLKSEYLDSLDIPVEALSAREKAISAKEWELPALDILESPDEPSLYYRGEVHLRASEFASASEEFRILLNMDPQGEYASKSLFSLAQLHFEMDEPKSALAYLDTLSWRFPNSAENRSGMRLRPVIQMADKKYLKAIANWKELLSVEENPDSLFYYHVRCIICRYRLGRLEDARLTARELYKQFDDRSDIDQFKALFYLEKGRALDRVRRFEEALKQYKTILKSYSFTRWADDAAYSIGYSLIQGGEIQQGAAELERYIENYPDSNLVYDALLTIGLAYYRIEKYSEAVSSLKKVWDNQELDELWQPAYKALIEVYRDARFWDAAIRLSRGYIARYPDSPDKLDKQMNIGYFYLQLSQWDDAISYYKPLLPIADAEREAEVQFYIGEAYMSKGDYQTAILEYLKVKVLGRKTKLDWGVTALYKAGNCYEKLGDRQGAARMYRKIIVEMGEASNYGATARKRLDGLELENNE